MSGLNALALKSRMDSDWLLMFLSSLSWKKYCYYKNCVIIIKLIALVWTIL